MSLEAEQERVASVPVEAGVFALRYLSSASEKPPRVFVEVSPVSRADVQVVFVPGKPVGVLEKPRQLALVVAERRGRLQLTVSPSPGGGTSARVELEPLLQESEAGETLPVTVEPVRILSNPALTCHVAKRGDVAAAGGEWVGGPGAPAVIEGVQLDWPGVDPAAIEYQALLQGGLGQWSPWVQAGAFVGTRGRGVALVGLRIRLSASAPANARLVGEAAFLGCPLVKEQGRELELASYAAVDPLVGLRLRVESGTAVSPEIVIGEAQRAAPEPLPASTALRVFKSKRASDRAAGLGG